MGVEAIVEVIASEAAEEAATILATARARADELVASARSEAAERVRAACAREEPAYRAEAMRRVNAARVAQLERRAADAAERVDQVTTAAAESLAAISGRADDPRWSAGLARLVAETAAIIGADGRIRVRAADAERARPIAAAHGCTLEVAGPTDGGPGPVDGLDAGVSGRSADGRIEVDATLRARLARARRALAGPIAESLGVDA